ncbi:hypothetical protein FNJ87_12555 [Nonlabens mediterrranea]|uniref:Tetratricopeptide repeat protein n=1 Tax=Nonlabens mediterrranea TaxID=1419947 RepID=A0ABS0A750_9FLAO|nr:hypothetical protein [Nonlabens mediterrranea]
MKSITTFLILFISLSINAQSGYEKAMIKGFELMKTDLLAASQQFERIAAAETDKWEPAYYVAFCNINSSWGQNPKDKTVLYMKKAQDFINDANAISMDNPELMVLQGLLNTCWITYDAKTYGMKLSAETTALYEKAYKIAPDNPRVALSRGDWLMGSARYFGKDITPYCKLIDKAVVLFENEKVTGFKPSWGKERAIEVQSTCNKE